MYYLNKRQTYPLILTEIHHRTNNTFLQQTLGIKHLPVTKDYVANVIEFK